MALISPMLNLPGCGNADFCTDDGKRSDQSRASRKYLQDECAQYLTSIIEYEIIEKPRKFFKKGRFFMTHWVEPAGYSEGAPTPNLPFEKLRRFVVIRNKPAHCLCLPVHTYGRQATSKPGVVADDHAAIVPVGKSMQLHAEEKPLGKRPLYMILEDSEVDIDYMSRVDFARIYTFEYNVPIRNIGRVSAESMGALEEYCMLAPTSKLHAPSLIDGDNKSPIQDFISGDQLPGRREKSMYEFEVYSDANPQADVSYQEIVFFPQDQRITPRSPKELSSQTIRARMYLDNPKLTVRESKRETLMEL